MFRQSPPSRAEQKARDDYFAAQRDAWRVTGIGDWWIAQFGRDTIYGFLVSRSSPTFTARADIEQWIAEQTEKGGK